MNCLVTGGSGFLGSHVADILTKKGFNVFILDKKKSKYLKKKQKFIKVDLLDDLKLKKVLKNMDYVFHFGGLADLNEALTKPIETIKINILGTAHLLKYSCKNKVKRFIHASTIYVNSNQGGFYRTSKKAAEDYVEEFSKRFGLNYTILRYGSLYGERAENQNGITRTILDAIKKNKIIYPGSKKTVREYIHVKDAAIATVNCLNNKYKNKHVNITGNKKIKVYKFLKILSRLLNIKKIIFKNKKILGHYVVTPYTFKPKIGKKMKLKKTINFEQGIKKLVSEKINLLKI